jgi:hypothetical protein
MSSPFRDIEFPCLFLLNHEDKSLPQFLSTLSLLCHGSLWLVGNIYSFNAPTDDSRHIGFALAPP